MELDIQTFGAGRDLVLLHGWGLGARALGALAQDLARGFRVHLVALPGYAASAPCEPYTLEAIAMRVAANAPPRACAIGWSLGAQLALAWAQRCPAQVERLVLIAATPRFASAMDWPHGVDPEQFDDFAASVAREPAPALARFAGLQAQGAGDPRHVLRSLRTLLDGEPAPGASVLSAGLSLLRDGDLRRMAAEVGQPALLLHGEGDALVPLAAAQWLAAAMPDARLRPVAGAGHAPFLSHRAQVSEAVAQFCR